MGGSAALNEMTGRDKAVASVITLSANDEDLCGRKGFHARSTISRDLRSGILHQGQAWNAVTLAGQFVDFPHLRRRENSHMVTTPRA